MADTVAFNHGTGEGVALRDGKWMPVTKDEIAINPQTFEIIIHNGGEWQSAGKTKSPGMLEGTTDAMTKGLTLGLTDEVGALGGAAGSYVRGVVTGEDVSFPKEYNRLVERARRRQRQFRSENPVASTTAEIAGGLGLGGVGLKAVRGAAPTGVPLVNKLWQATPKALGPGMVGTMGRSAIVGAEIGGAAGLGNAEGGPVERLKGAGQGAIAGGVLGGVLPPVAAGAGKLGRGVWQVLADRIKVGGYDGPRSAAMRKVLEALREDKMTPDQALQKLRSLGGEAMIADSGGESMLRLAEGVASVKGPAASAASRAYKGRASTMPARLGQALNKVTGTNQGVYGTELRQSAARAAAAKQGYGEAFAETPILESPAIRALIADSADIRAAISQARRMPQYKDMPDNSIELLDKAYKNIGGKATEAYRAGDGSKYHDLKQLRDALREAIKAQSPKYDAAVAKFSDDMGVADALEAGKNILKPGNESAATIDYLKTLGEAEVTAFLTGVRGAVIGVMNKSGKGADVANKLINYPGVRNQLKAALGGDKIGAQRFDVFRKFLRAETHMAQNKNFVTGGPATARRLASQENVGVDPMPLADAAMGRYGSAATGVLRNVGQWWSRPPAGVRDELSVLFSNKMAKNQAVLAGLKRREALRAAPKLKSMGLNKGLAASLEEYIGGRAR